MTDFEYDCMQKKRIARSAQNRKCGSKSKRCNLPSDHMTHKQWKERNGKVSTVKMNEPMTWKDFKAISKELQSEYLNGLIRRYNVSATVIAKEMFGINNQYLCTYVRSQNLNVKFQKGLIMSDKLREAWEKFLNPEPIEHEVLVEEVPEEVVNESAAEELINENQQETVEQVCAFDPSGVLAMIGCKPQSKVVCSSGTQMKQFSLLFEGELDVNMIMNSVRGILGDGRVGKLQIIYEQ